MATVKYLFDEHINPILAQGLFLKEPSILVVQAYQHFAGRSDEDHLAWAHEFGFIFVTLDVNTVLEAAYSRIRQNISTEGVFVLRTGFSFATLLDELFLVAMASELEEWANKITFIPIQ